MLIPAPKVVRANATISYIYVIVPSGALDIELDVPYTPVLVFWRKLSNDDKNRNFSHEQIDLSAYIKIKNPKYRYKITGKFSNIVIIKETFIK
jgi:hypothetical protein